MEPEPIKEKKDSKLQPLNNNIDQSFIKKTNTMYIKKGSKIALTNEDLMDKKSKTRRLVNLRDTLHICKVFSSLNTMEGGTIYEDLESLLSKRRKCSGIIEDCRYCRNSSCEIICDNTQKKDTKKFLSSLRKKMPKLSSLEKGVYFHLEQNPKTRDYMEDYLNIENSDNQNLVFVLCDGHSGYKAAEIVVNELPKLFLRHLKNEKENNELPKDKACERAILNSFIDMDDILLEELNDDSSGCTTNLIYLCTEEGKRIVYSGNVGDSRSVLIRKDGPLRLSYDHKAVDKEEQTRVRSEGGVIIRKRLYGTLAITRSHGDFEMKETITCLSNKPHITKNEIMNTDMFIVIGSDGVWDVIKDEEVYQMVLSGDFQSLDITTLKPKDLAKILVKKAVGLGSKDNISCIAIKLN